MTTATFKHIDPTTYDPHATEPLKKPWSKVDGPGYSYKLKDYTRSVHNLRGQESDFSIDNSGFGVYSAPSEEKLFTDDTQIRKGYFADVEALLQRELLGVKKFVIFDYTIRRRDKNSPRQPVQLVDIDQTQGAAEARIVGIWRPIQYPVIDTPLAMVDARSMGPDDFAKLDLLYPKNSDHLGDSLPDPDPAFSTEGYEVKVELYAIAPNDKHRFYYMKDMTPDGVLFIKCFDSHSAQMTGGKTDIAHGAGHTAFVDQQTPADAPGRQSIEVRCLVFYG